MLFSLTQAMVQALQPVQAERSMAIAQRRRWPGGRCGASVSLGLYIVSGCSRGSCSWFCFASPWPCSLACGSPGAFDAGVESSTPDLVSRCGLGVEPGTFSL